MLMGVVQYHYTCRNYWEERVEVDGGRAVPQGLWGVGHDRHKAAADSKAEDSEQK